MSLQNSAITPPQGLIEDKSSNEVDGFLDLPGVIATGFEFEAETGWLREEVQQDFGGLTNVMSSNEINYALAVDPVEDKTIYSGEDRLRVSHYGQRQLGHRVERSVIKIENDRSIIAIEDQIINFQQSSVENNPAFDLIGLTRLRNDPQFTGIDGSGFSVAIIDSGLDINHSLIAPNYVAGYDFVNDDQNPLDLNGHGTHISGVIGATDENIGVATDVGLISLQVLDGSGQGDVTDIENALEWVLEHQAEYNITAVNLSLGGGFFTSESEIRASASANDLLRLQEDIQNLEAAGVTVVAAAGNGYSVNEGKSNQANLAFPAISSTIAVGAVWRDGSESTIFWDAGSTDFSTGADRIPSFSQRLAADNMIFAPGAIITSTLPGNQIGEYAGTSQAAPHIAGTVALLQEASLQFGDRLLTPREVNEILRTTGDAIFDGDDEDDSVTNTNVGYLRVNVYEAIAEVKRRGESIPVPPPEDNNDVIEEGGSNNTITEATIALVLDGSPVSPIRASIGWDGNQYNEQDVDLYNLQLTSPGKVTIEVKSDTVEPDDFDSYLRLFDAAGNQIAANDDIDLDSGNFFSRIETELTPGTYYVGVSGFGNSNYDPLQTTRRTPGDEGNYSLHLSSELDRNDDNNSDLSRDREPEVNLGANSDDVIYYFSHQELNVNFYTTSVDERNSLVARGDRYRLEGESFESATEERDRLSGAKPIYRFVNNSTGAHLYTIFEQERNFIRNNLGNYNAEGIAFYGYETEQLGTVPFYRLYNTEADTHLLTPSVTERNEALNNDVFDYRLEGNNGIAFYVEAGENA